MYIIEIAPQSNGAHRNQTSNEAVPYIPEGWALLPGSVGTPDTLENYPFGVVSVEDVEGVPTVKSWTPRPIPEPEPVPEEEKTYTESDMISAMIGG